MSVSQNFEDDDWDDLIDNIAHGHVLPVIGPALVTVADAAGGQRPLYQALAPQLARKLGLPEGDWQNTMQVAREAIGSNPNVRATTVWDRLKTLLKAHDTPGPGLLALAAIDGFDLYIASTPDDQMVRALESAQRGFDAQRQVFYFCDRGRATPHPAAAARKSDMSTQLQQYGNCDLPMPLSGVTLYQVMGSLHAPSAPVWEEDYMEYICTLLEKSTSVENLLSQLRSRDLLLIGAPSDDWIVRFFMRVARGKRLSEDAPHTRHRFAEARTADSAPMLFFFEQATRLTRVIEGDPQAFALELQRRWSQRLQKRQHNLDIFIRVGDRCPNGGVFISYAREDIAPVETLVRALLVAGVPVWLDKRELESGGNYDRALQAEIKQACCLFVSVVSPTTEDPANRGRYLHRERHWAAERHVDGYVFYLKLLCGLPAGHREEQEPAVVHQVQRHRQEDMNGFVQRVKALVDEHRSGKRMRG